MMIKVKLKTQFIKYLELIPDGDQWIVKDNGVFKELDGWHMPDAHRWLVMKGYSVIYVYSK